MSARNYFPKLIFGAGTEYTKNFRDNNTTIMSIGDAFINPYTRFQSILGITVAYNIFDFGIRGKSLKIAKENLTLKELEQKLKMQELSLTLLDAYTKVLITSEQIDINNEILALQEENYRYFERLFNIKEITKAELNNEKVKMITTKNKLSDLASVKQESLNWISFYTGEKFSINNLQAEKFGQNDFDINSFTDYTKSLL